MSKRILSYPGSKWRIAKQITRYIPEHHTYVEPYFGSGAVLFTKSPSAIETVNDLDDVVVNFFECVRNRTEDLVWAVSTMPYSRTAYNEAYKKLWTYKDPLEGAVALMVCCWQGHGTKLNNAAGWKADIQGREYAYTIRNWNNLPDIIRDTAARLKLVQIEHQSALSIINKYDYKDVFMYIDPPYPLSVRSGEQYRYEMTEDDHETLLKTICHSTAKIMISSYNNALYDDYLKKWNKLVFSSNTVAGAAREEVVWCNYAVEQDFQMSLL